MKKRSGRIPPADKVQRLIECLDPGCQTFHERCHSGHAFQMSQFETRSLDRLADAIHAANAGFRTCTVAGTVGAGL